MGSPVSDITAEIFLQNRENYVIKHIMENKTITDYILCMHDFLIYLYNENRIRPRTVLETFSKQHKNLKSL
jgi:hypothetical protein